MKLVLNTWLAFEVEAAAEAAALVDHFGLPPAALVDAVDHNPLASPLARAKLAKIVSADDRTDFSLGWATKDLDLVRESSGVVHAPIAAAIARRWQGLLADGYGGLDVERGARAASAPRRPPQTARLAPPPRVRPPLATSAGSAVR